MKSMQTRSDWFGPALSYLTQATPRSFMAWSSLISFIS